MGVFDKFKKILFDEEIEEVPTGEEELPERTPKKNFRSESGFVDHNGQKEEDVIKEVVYSPNSDEPELSSSRSTKYGSEEYEKKEDIPRQISRYEEPSKDVASEIEHEIEKHHDSMEDVRPHAVEEHERRYDFGSDFDKPEVHEDVRKKEEKEDSFVQTDKYGLRRDYKAILRQEKEVRHGELEHKDYAAIVKETVEQVPGKKPFVVTPVISPVYGILDKNYTPESVIERNKDNSNLEAQKKRLYGATEEEIPVVREKKVVEKKEEVKKEEEPKTIIEEKPKEEEYIESIKNIIDEDIPKNKSVEDMVEDTAEYTPVEPTIEYEEPEEIESPKEEIPEVEEDYYEEPEEIEEDSEEMEAPSVSIDTLIDNPMEDEEEAPRQELDDTIETDLFNLIDSMYSKEDEGE